MTGAASVIAGSLAAALERAATLDRPFRHHRLHGVLPAGLPEAVAALPVAAAAIGDTAGRRETHNQLRIFFDPANRGRHAVCEFLAAALQDASAVAAVERLCGVPLRGAYLRIEYCQDRAGFWLEPHTDIAAKKVTLLVYLSDDPGSDDWGTDIYDAALNPVARVPYRRNAGLAFVPGADTWHGFTKRPIAGVRKSLIVNYVDAGWRSRHELSFPDHPVGTCKE